MVSCDSIHPCLDHSLLTTFAFDVDLQCTLAYHLTFGAALIEPNLQVQLDDEDNLPLSRVVSMMCLNSTGSTCLVARLSNLGVCSPPCPLWSKTIFLTT